jgi:hypothetical protein
VDSGISISFRLKRPAWVKLIVVAYEGLNNVRILPHLVSQSQRMLRMGKVILATILTPIPSSKKNHFLFNFAQTNIHTSVYMMRKGGRAQTRGLESAARPPPTTISAWIFT